MPRPPEFDRDEVLTRAMNAFWQYGYASISISKLESATGLGRGSLYAAFGDKSGLFLSALRHYRAKQLVPIIESLDGFKSGRQAIERRFSSIIEMHGHQDAWMGCLMVNSIAGLNDTDHSEEVQSELLDMRQKLENAYHRAVKRGREAGEMSTVGATAKVARSLTILDMGLALLLRLGVEKQVLRDSVAPILSTLN
ncbi:MAG: TetR/AcrR family transcriptional regulator [Cyanobacteria bacterium P01_E01_bin.6]